VGQVGEGRFHGDQPVEQVLLVVLEAEVEHVGLAARSHVAGHLEGHRRLARALRASDEHQLAGPQSSPDRLVHWGEAQRHGLVLADLAGRDLVVEIDQHVQGGPGRHAAVGCIESPAALGGRGGHVGDLSGHEQTSSR